MELCDVGSALGSLHCVDVGNVAYISDVGVVSLFRDKVCRVGEFPHVHSNIFQINLATEPFCT
jgi:hypothetical protein